MGKKSVKSFAQNQWALGGAKLVFLKKAALVLLALGLILLQFACSSLSIRVKQRCQSVDVRQKGLSDGLKGLPKSVFETDFKKCLEYGVSLDRKLYYSSWEEGLKQFCRPEKALDMGRKGRKYHNVCPEDLEKEFLKAYKKGDQECLLAEGRNQALSGGLEGFEKSSCQKLSGKAGREEYSKGWKKGQKAFCVYKKGYDFALKGLAPHKICVVKGGGLLKLYRSGYRKGTEQCYFKKGYNEATSGKTRSVKTASSIGNTACVDLTKKSNREQYNTGWQKGIKDFCSYASGYKFGLKGGEYQNTCRKADEDVFFRAYSMGLKEYKAEQRQKELLAVERERIQAEERARWESLRLQEEQIYAEERARQESLRLQEERIQAEERDRRESLNLQKENLRQLKLKNYQLCRYNSDCGPNTYCRYNYELEEKVCR